MCSSDNTYLPLRLLSQRRTRGKAGDAFPGRMAPSTWEISPMVNAMAKEVSDSVEHGV